MKPKEENVNEKIDYVEGLISTTPRDSTKYDDFSKTLSTLKAHRASFFVANIDPIQNSEAENANTSALVMDLDPNVRNITDPGDKSKALTLLKEKLKKLEVFRLNLVNQ